MDHYQTLGVSKNATPDEIKKAYRKLASQHHPDKGGETAMFQKIEEAYRVLSDPKQRQQYDSPHPQFRGHPGGFEGFDINEIFGHFFRQHAAHQPRPETTYRTFVPLTLEQIHKGGEHVLQLMINGKQEVVKIEIPDNADNGVSYRYGIRENTTLLVEFRVVTHPKFEKRGYDLYSTQEVDILDFITGTSFQFVNIGEKTFEVTVKPKTIPGTLIKLAGQGLRKGAGFGDQYILLKPYYSDKITDAVINRVNELKKEL